MQTMPDTGDGVANATPGSETPFDEHVHRQPVLTRPYCEPKRHWKTVGGETSDEIVSRRRPADEPLPMGQSLATQQALGFDDDRVDCGAIDELRSDVREWRDQGWTGTSNLRRKENRQVLEGLLGRDGCPEALNAAFGWTSQPFPVPKSGETAVRVVTATGGMMSWSGPAVA